jgi:DNA-binding NarL/FixJ family response regulator
MKSCARACAWCSVPVRIWNGQEAVLKALRLNPDLMIMDVTMPVLDGLSATKQIKQGLPKIPIIILSVHDGPEMIQAALEAGAQGFVTKNDVAAALLDAVDAVLHGETFFLPSRSQSDALQIRSEKSELAKW